MNNQFLPPDSTPPPMGVLPQGSTLTEGRDENPNQFVRS